MWLRIFTISIISLAALTGCTLEALVTCDSNQHLDKSSGQCVDNSPMACGDDAFDCTSAKGVQKVGCSLDSETKIAHCIVSACDEPEYIMVGGLFDKNGKASKGGIYQGFCMAESSEHCGSNDSNCETDKPANAKSVSCDTGKHKCRIDECESGLYKLVDRENDGYWINECIEKNCEKEFCTAEIIANSTSHSCDVDNTDHECTVTECNQGYYIDEQGRCSQNTDEHCGSIDNNCLDDTQYTGHEKSKKCDKYNGKCITELCGDAYELDDGECVERKIECEGNNAEKCMKDGVSAAKCEDFKCVIEACDLSTHHLSVTAKGTVCVEQSLESCSQTAEARNCKEILGFDKATAPSCEMGICRPGECEEKYHKAQMKLGDKVIYETCESNASQECGTEKINCQTTIEKAAVTDCKDEQECIVLECIDGYHVSADGKKCDADTVDECGKKKSNCAQSVPHWSAGSCSNGICFISACEAGFHLIANECIEDTVDACGNSLTNCTKKDGWSEGTCEAGQCKATKCNVPYHANNSNCEHDETDACGIEMTDCATVAGWGAGTCSNGGCVAVSCADGYHLKSGACVQDTPTSCGSDEKNCTTTINDWVEGTCTDGVCTLTKCTTGKHVSGNTCIDDSVSACGQPPQNCGTTLGWADGTCTNGKCVATACTFNFTLNQATGTCVFSGVVEPEVVTLCRFPKHICMENYCCPESVSCTEPKLYMKCLMTELKPIPDFQFEP